MKSIKKTFLLLATTLSIYSMQEPIKKDYNWIEVVANILLGEEEFNPDKVSFPPEVQYEIAHLLFTNVHANTLTIAAQTINTLARVNKQLNMLINDPEFCLKIIKHLAQQFNCSDYEAANKLQTQQAERQLQLQWQLYNLCKQFVVDEQSFAILYKKNVDFNFTYPVKGHTKEGEIVTVYCTPLIVAAKANNTEVLKRLCSIDRVKLTIDYCTQSGITALIAAICIQLPSPVTILLNAGADPEHSGKGIFTTPLREAQKRRNQEIIKLIQNAITEKHSKKSLHRRASESNITPRKPLIKRPTI